MSKLVDKYHELGKKVFAGVEKNESVENIREEMAKIKEQFGEEDWDELISQAPVHIRPMIKQQKDKYLNDKSK